jgi:hypothetical protein
MKNEHQHSVFVCVCVCVCCAFSCEVEVIIKQARRDNNNLGLVTQPLIAVLYPLVVCRNSIVCCARSLSVIDIQYSCLGQPSCKAVIVNIVCVLWGSLL